MAEQQAQRTVAAEPIAWSEIGSIFLILGVLGFGGPAAHLALMETELVTRRKWLSHEYFLDLLAAINLVPGPTSTEMALQIGYVVGGLRGMLLAGAGFILPAVFFSVALAMIYTAAGSVPAVQGLLLGVKPVVLVLILSAAYRLGVKAIDNTPMRVLLAIALIAIAVSSKPLMSAFGRSAITIPELVLLLATGATYIAWKHRRQLGTIAGVALAPLLSAATPVLAQQVPALGDLFWRFLIIGGTLFGSGYVLAAYMQRTFVDELHWLTPQRLLDVLAIGQATPGPLTSTASAAGYMLTVTPGAIWSGVPGAIVATLGVFLPAFVVVLILGRVVPYIRRYPIVLDFLKGVNAGVIALLIGAFANLAWATAVRPDSSVDWLSLVLVGIAFILLERFKWNPIQLIVIGALVGVGRVMVGFG
ncbi:MAG: chromate efflux transporter [Chloroflexota bacterium]